MFPFGMEDETMLEKVTNDAWLTYGPLSTSATKLRDAEQGVVESKAYTARESLEGGLIDLIAENEEELLKLLDGRRSLALVGTAEAINPGTAGQAAWR